MTITPQEKASSRLQPLFCRYVLVLGLLVTASVYASADEAPSAKPADATTATNESNDAAYLKKLDARVATIVASLGVDQEKGARLHALIVAQYRAVNDWHAAHDARLKELRGLVKEADADKTVAAKREILDTTAVLLSLHHRFIAALGNDLNAELIEKVKDGMTVGKVQFTYGGYLEKYPELTDAQKAQVLKLLKAAREEAMDAGSMDAKSAIFNQYKGKINNYLAAQGVGKNKGQKEKPAGNESLETQSK